MDTHQAEIRTEGARGESSIPAGTGVEKCPGGVELVTETLTSCRDCRWIQICLSVSIVAPAFSLDKFDNNVAPVIGRRGKESSDWPNCLFYCVHLSSASYYQVLRI